MPSLSKAEIYEVTSGDNPTLVGEKTDVQFNPESLSLSLSNRIEGGRSSGRQVRQFVGSSSNTFSLDLEFDTADEGTTDEPVSVLERTRVLDKFIQPKTEGNNSSEQPAKLRFHWGDLIIDGIVESIDLELDHFAHNGKPLHAKVTLKLKEQKIELQYSERGGGDSASGAQDQPQVAQALDDELPSQAAARLGLDPSDWRGLGFELGLDLSLEAGLELSFEAGISASLGVDIKAGIDADINLDLAAKLGLEAGAKLSLSHLPSGTDTRQQVSSSIALAKAGGISSASYQLATQSAIEASSSSATAFNLGAHVASTVSASNKAASATIVSAGAPASSARAASAGKSAVSRSTLTMPPDSRATTFGYSIPLQNRRVPILDQQDSLRASTASLNNLSTVSSGRKAADAVQLRRRPNKRCGCHSSCKH